jgi:hypothetical protein
MISGAWANTLASSDRYILKVFDKTISVQDFKYQLRNLKALNCIFDDSVVILYFQKKIIKDLEEFLNKFPEQNEKVILYLHQNEELLKQFRIFFKMLRYSEDQNKTIGPKLIEVIQETNNANKCGSGIIFKESLKTNFKALIEMELFLRARFEGQLKSENKRMDIIRSSIDLFVDSIDKQFNHEYFW